MKLRESAISLSLVLAISIGTFIPSAHASRPSNTNFTSTATSARFASALRDLYTLDAAGRKKVFQVKNHKGESIFRASRARTLEAGLWSTLDPARDQVEGTSTEKAYQNFNISANSNEIVVAVIDSGVDITHEDLKGHIWVNLQELNGRPGVDDDGDGYVDDIYGWNFLGNKNGDNINGQTLEVTRVYAALKAKQDAGQALTPEETGLFTEASAEFLAGAADAQQGFDRYTEFDAAIRLLKANGLVEETTAGLAAVTSTEPVILQAVQLVKIAFDQDMTSADITEGLDYYKMEVDYNYSLTFNSSTIVGDNPNILNEKGYGNNDVTGPDASHGTHVAGIIAANRLNNFGINGQGKNIKIMPIRTVPNGDERDKDVGNAVRFAVDHGARIINMSFGKDFSPNKAYVDAAMKYAEAAGVLIVHAAGNDSKNTETANNYPSRKISDGQGNFRDIETWIEVGASSKEKGVNLPADFSNFGKTSVDIFAPGKDIISTVPGNQYASFSGTSMASPETAGVAALLLELYPNATAQELKHAILSTANLYNGLSCALPGTADATAPTLVGFSDLSVTGGTVNAYQAMVQMQNL
jgi:cell wall-associated protease